MSQEYFPTKVYPFILQHNNKTREETTRKIHLITLRRMITLLKAIAITTLADSHMLVIMLTYKIPGSYFSRVIALILR